MARQRSADAIDVKPTIAKLGHVALTTPDMERSLHFWKDIVGLIEVDRDGQTVFLRAWGEFEHHSLSLRPGLEGLVDHIAWRAARPEDVDGFARLIESQGRPIHRVEAGREKGQGRAIRFLPPSGHVFEIYYDVDKPKAPVDLRSRLRNGVYRMGGPGVAPRRIDHVNLQATDPVEMSNWLQETMGFKTREYVVNAAGDPFIFWMSVTPLVHDVAVGPSRSGRAGMFNHVAFWVDNWQDVFRGADIMMENGVEMNGPGRHGISQATYMYVRDPGSNVQLEVFSGGYLIFDPDWEPIMWRPEDLNIGLTWWGSPKPAGIPPDEFTGTLVPAELSISAATANVVPRGDDFPASTGGAHSDPLKSK